MGSDERHGRSPFRALLASAGDIAQEGGTAIQAVERLLGIRMTVFMQREA
jgi:hypothetical protein